MSQSEINQAVRVLSDKRLKYTARLLLRDGQIHEIQLSAPPTVEFNAEARELLLMSHLGEKYSTSYPIMRWAEVALLNVEENPL